MNNDNSRPAFKYGPAGSINLRTFKQKMLTVASAKGLATVLPSILAASSGSGNVNASASEADSRGGPSVGGTVGGSVEQATHWNHWNYGHDRCHWQQPRQ